jgi:excisionase family DNA binding protein
VTKSTGGNWLGVPALAKELGVTLRTVYAILDAGEIPCYRIRRVLRIKRVDVDAYLERAKVEPGELRHLYLPGERRRVDDG